MAGISALVEMQTYGTFILNPWGTMGMYLFAFFLGPLASLMFHVTAGAIRGLEPKRAWQLVVGQVAAMFALAIAGIIDQGRAGFVGNTLPTLIHPFVIGAVMCWNTYRTLERTNQKMLNIWWPLNFGAPNDPWYVPLMGEMYRLFWDVRYPELTIVKKDSGKLPGLREYRSSTRWFLFGGIFVVNACFALVLDRRCACVKIVCGLIALTVAAMFCTFVAAWYHEVGTMIARDDATQNDFYTYVSEVKTKK